MALAASALDLLGIGSELEPLAALLGLEDELDALYAGDEADDHVVVLGLDDRDAAARALELGDLIGLAQQHVAVARRCAARWRTGGHSRGARSQGAWAPPSHADRASSLK